MNYRYPLSYSKRVSCALTRLSQSPVPINHAPASGKSNEPIPPYPFSLFDTSSFEIREPNQYTAVFRGRPQRFQENISPRQFEQERHPDTPGTPRRVVRFLFILFLWLMKRCHPMTTSKYQRIVRYLGSCRASVTLREGLAGNRESLATDMLDREGPPVSRPGTFGRSKPPGSFTSHTSG